jgi:hypothetical protein
VHRTSCVQARPSSSYSTVAILDGHCRNLSARKPRACVNGGVHLESTSIYF